MRLLLNQANGVYTVCQEGLCVPLYRNVIGINLVSVTKPSVPYAYRENVLGI